MLNKLSKSLVFAVVFGIISMTLTLHSFADSKPLEINIVDKGKNDLHVQWNKVEGADYYTLISDGEILYKGKKTKFIQSKLKPATLVEYNLHAFNKNDELLESYRITTYTTLPEKDAINYSIGESNSTIKLNWSNVSGAIKYKVYNDDELLAETTKSEFTHRNLEGGKESDYRVIIYTPNTDSKDESIETNNSSKKYKYDYKLLILKAETLPENRELKNKGVSQHKSFSSMSLQKVTSLTSRTFIQEACWSEGIPDSGDGDGRNLHPYSGSHRTQVTIETYWNERTWDYGIDIGESVRYSDNNCQDEAERGTASTSSDDNVTQTSWSGSYVKYEINHSIGAPFVEWLAPNIDYQYTITMYEDGGSLIDGQHDGFPNYEVYRGDSWEDGWTQIYYWDASQNNQGFYSLEPPMEIEISN